MRTFLLWLNSLKTDFRFFSDTFEKSNNDYKALVLLKWTCNGWNLKFTTLTSAISSLDTYTWCHYCLKTIPNLNQRKICNCKSKLFFSNEELYNRNNSNDDLISGHWNPIYTEEEDGHHAVQYDDNPNMMQSSSCSSIVHLPPQQSKESIDKRELRGIFADKNSVEYSPHNLPQRPEEYGGMDSTKVDPPKEMQLQLFNIWWSSKPPSAVCACVLR